MRILEVIRSLDPAGGGPIEGVKQTGIVLLKEGHAVDVASLDDPAAPFLKQFPLRVYPQGPVRGSYGFNSRFIPWIREHAPAYDIVVVDGIWQFHSYAVRCALRKSSTPYVVFTHGMLDPWFKRRYPLKHFKKWLYWPWGDYRVCRDADAVLFTCEEERILARQSFWLYKAKEVVVSYGTSVPDGKELHQRAVFFNRYPELQGKRLAVFLSRIHPKKGCDLAITAFSQTAAKDPAWRLVLAGPDQVGWRPELQALSKRLGVADRIIWTGSVEGDMKWGVLRAAEVLLLPSHQENFGVVVAESLGCGTPVLISNKVNIHREVESAGAGLVAKDDSLGTRSLLQRWIEMSVPEQQQMRRNARKCFEACFEIRRAVELLTNALRKVISDRAASPTSSAASRSAELGRSLFKS